MSTIVFTPRLRTGSSSSHVVRHFPARIALVRSFRAAERRERSLRQPACEIRRGQGTAVISKIARHPSPDPGPTQEALAKILRIFDTPTRALASARTAPFALSRACAVRKLSIDRRENPRRASRSNTIRRSPHRPHRTAVRAASAFRRLHAQPACSRASRTSRRG